MTLRHTEQQALKSSKTDRQVASDDSTRLRPVADASFATTLASGLQILASMPPGGAGVRNSDLSSELRLSRPTVSRLCSTLVELGYLIKGRGGRYHPGPRVLTLAHPMLTSLGIRQRAHPLMRDFAERAHGNVALGMVDGLHAVNVEIVRLIHDSTAHMPEIGMRVPLERSSLGRALLSMKPESTRQRVLDAIARERPESWERFGADMLEGIEHCRTRGFCIVLGSFDPGLYAVATPLGRTRDGNYDIAINCGIRSYRTSETELREHWGPRLVALTHSLRALDGGLLPPFEAHGS